MSARPRRDSPVRSPRAMAYTEPEFICVDVRHDEEMRSLIDQTVKRFSSIYGLRSCEF